MTKIIEVRYRTSAWEGYVTFVPQLIADYFDEDLAQMPQEYVGLNVSTCDEILNNVVEGTYDCFVNGEDGLSIITQIPKNCVFLIKKIGGNLDNPRTVENVDSN